MKKWMAIVMVAGFLILLLAWIGSRERVNAYRDQVKELEQKVAEDPEDQVVRRRLARLEKEKGDKIRLEDLLSVLPEPARRYYQGGLGNLDDISFYGEVVDQHGNPVAGATFNINVMGSFLIGGGVIRTVSREDGSMRVKTQGGRFFEIDSILHPRCYFVSPVRWSSGARTSLRFFGYEPDEQTPGFSWLDYTATNPYVFRMWCIENQENIVSGRAGAAGPSSPRDNGNYSRFVTIDLEMAAKGQRGSRKEGHEGSGHIRIAMFSEPYGAWHTKSAWDPEIGSERARANEEERTWWVEISAVDGGFVPVREGDIYMNEAPESGYQPMIRFEGRDKVNAGVKGLYYYFKANGGQQYGVMSINIDYVSSLSSGQHVEFYYKMNMSGSRNLALMDWAH